MSNFDGSVSCLNWLLRVKLRALPETTSVARADATSPIVRPHSLHHKSIAVDKNGNKLLFYLLSFWPNEILLDEFVTTDVFR